MLRILSRTPDLFRDSGPNTTEIQRDYDSPPPRRLPRGVGDRGLSLQWFALGGHTRGPNESAPRPLNEESRRHERQSRSPSCAQIRDAPHRVRLTSLSRRVSSPQEYSVATAPSALPPRDDAVLRPPLKECARRDKSRRGHSRLSPRGSASVDDIFSFISLTNALLSSIDRSIRSR